MQRVVVILAVVLAIPCFGGDLDKKLPSLEDLIRHGCIVSGPVQMSNYNDPLLRLHTVWTVNFWAEHGTFKESKRDWKLFYSFRKSRKKALADCDKFMTRVEKLKKGNN